MHVRSIRALLQFCTTLPLGRAADFEAFARRSYLYPIAGYIIGGIAALLAFGIESPVLAAAVGLAAVLILSGANHFDGLLDFGDGLMAHGNREKRILAMTDRNTGAGAVAAGLVVTLVAFAGLQTAAPVWATILIAEVSAKLAMAWLTVLGRPFREGIHSYLHGFARPSFLIYAAALALPLLLLPVPPAVPGMAVAVTGAVVVGMLALSRNIFGGVNGDVVGAAHEITRAAVILVLALL